MTERQTERQEKQKGGCVVRGNIFIIIITAVGKLEKDAEGLKWYPLVLLGKLVLK
jgi:hypothetical protein